MQESRRKCYVEDAVASYDTQLMKALKIFCKDIKRERAVRFFSIWMGLRERERERERERAIVGCGRLK